MTAQHDLESRLEEFLSAAEDERQKPFRELTTALKDSVKAERFDEAAAVLRRATLPSLDYTSLQTLYRIFALLHCRLASPKQVARLAIMSSFTTKQLTQLIELFLFAAGVAAEIYEADYGVFHQEILDPDSGLYDFKPKTLFLATSWRDLLHTPALSDDLHKVRTLVEAELAHWSSLWEMVHDRLGCQIVQNNCASPPWRVLHNHELRHPGGLARFVSEINRAFVDHAPAFVTIHDADHLAATAGRWSWASERFFHHAKLPCAPEYLPDYAHSISSIILAQLGLVKKCLVLDLDNTLWGGVIGDEGLGGIRLGQGDAEGEAFQAFQRYVRDLRLRGVIIAVCSKNEEALAREVFEKHPEMVLRLDDISRFIANWNDKASNLNTIAEDLNIGLNSLVFVDDNPAERALVRRFVPEVAVPELPADPSEFIRALELHRYFQVVSLGVEDYKRTEYYQTNAARREAQASTRNVDEFLESLQMVARIGPIDATSLERSAQLINRSNQFNLTTRRYSVADLLAFTKSENWITRTVSLADRFGDNGLISVLLAKLEGEVLLIDTWLMSCRVLKRGVEHFLLNHLYKVAQEQGVNKIRGEYIPTVKNGLVRDHYAQLGFKQIGTEEDGRTSWELSITEGFTPRRVFMQEMRTNG